MQPLIRLLALLFLLIGQTHALSLREAANYGYVSVSAYASSSYTEAAVIIQSLVSFSVDIDFSTTYFVQPNESQRVGLTYEKSTGAYFLRITPGFDQTLYFDARCLDANRGVPQTNVYYTSIGEISTQFASIYNALRANYDQSSVWNITDYSGAYSQSWKEADARYVPPGGGGGGGVGSNIDLTGPASWSISGGKIRIKVAEVANPNEGGISGSLRLRVWATKQKYRGGRLTGYVLGSYALDQLEGGYVYPNISRKVPYKRPRKGTYYTVLTVEEYTDSGWVVEDYITFSKRTKF